MKIAVLNGSPKGMTSVTMQYVRFLQERFPQHQFEILHVCQDLKRWEEQPEALGEAIASIRASDAVLWAFPLYVLAVHANYKRFIELVFERGLQDAFRGKHAAVLTTSIRFFDHTAHNYVHAVCDDLDMPYVGGFSAAMYDLLEPGERERLERFAEGFLRAAGERLAMPKCYEPVRPQPFRYVPGENGSRISAGGRRIVVVTDARPEDANLRAMVEKFTGCLAEPPEVVNLHDVQIRGGCLGCIHCGLDNVCVYRDVDQVDGVYRKLMAADVLVYAGIIRDRFLSARWKLFLDRGFFHNHVPMFAGKQFGWLISGPLAQIANLREILEAFAGLQRTNLFGLVTDECGDSRQLDRLLESFAHRMAFCADRGYFAPPNFFTVAGGKLFRDEIWANLRGVFPNDHRYYREHGLYNFPRRSIKTRIGGAIMTLLLKIPAFRREYLKQIKSRMIEPLEKVIDEMKARH